MYIRFILENAIVRITASGKMTSFCAYTTRVFRNVSAIFNFFLLNVCTLIFKKPDLKNSIQMPSKTSANMTKYPDIFSIQ